MGKKSGPVMTKGKDSNQSAGTPQWLFKAIDSYWRFGIDLAADSTNTKLTNHLTEQDNSLAWPWHVVTGLGSGSPGWCNHPYANCGLWIGKAYDEALLGATVVQLQPAAVHRNYYAKYVKDTPGLPKPCAVVLLNCAVKFDGYPCASSIVHALFIWNKGLLQAPQKLFQADPRNLGELHKVFDIIKGWCV